MLKNITMSIDEDLLKNARRKAISQNQVLNQLVRKWLEEYVSDPQSLVDNFDYYMENIKSKNYKIEKSNRDERNER